MIVKSSHLALRFYKNDGWTMALLSECLEKGSAIEFCPGIGLEYYRLEVGSRLDLDKLMPHVTNVQNWRNELIGPSREYIDKMMW